MINKISVSMPNMAKFSSTSFGLAKLNDIGRESADSFEMQRNTFLDSKLFKKSSFFAFSPAIVSKLKEGENFADLCRDYGCSRNAKTNAQFIKTQIIDKNAYGYFCKHVPEEEMTDAILSLYEHNYDNPDLSAKDTKRLLDLAKYAMETSEYVQNVGLLQAGTTR